MTFQPVNQPELRVSTYPGLRNGVRSSYSPSLPPWASRQATKQATIITPSVDLIGLNRSSSTEHFLVPSSHDKIYESIMMDNVVVWKRCPRFWTSFKLILFHLEWAKAEPIRFVCLNFMDLFGWGRFLVQVVIIQNIHGTLSQKRLWFTPVGHNLRPFVDIIAVIVGANDHATTVEYAYWAKSLAPEYKEAWKLLIYQTVNESFARLLWSVGWYALPLRSRTRDLDVPFSFPKVCCKQYIRLAKLARWTTYHWTPLTVMPRPDSLHVGNLGSIARSAWSWAALQTFHFGVSSFRRNQGRFQCLQDTLWQGPQSCLPFSLGAHVRDLCPPCEKKPSRRAFLVKETTENSNWNSPLHRHCRRLTPKKALIV